MVLIVLGFILWLCGVGLYYVKGKYNTTSYTWIILVMSIITFMVIALSFIVTGIVFENTDDIVNTCDTIELNGDTYILLECVDNYMGGIEYL